MVVHGVIDVTYSEVVRGVGAIDIALNFFALRKVFLDDFFFFFEKEDMAFIELFVEAISRGRGVEAIAEIDKDVVFDGEVVDQLVDEGDLEDVVGVVDYDLAGDEVIVHEDIVVENAVIDDGALATAVLAEIGMARFERLYVGDIFFASEQMSFRNEIGVVLTDCSVEGRRRLSLRRGHKQAADQERPDSLGF